ncbi:MAG: penicillin-binding protein 1B [Gammaproteobacteria bacterium]|nr:penicillin-binding protein 1B [Gammaproteobacteria bacterium]
MPSSTSARRFWLAAVVAALSLAAIGLSIYLVVLDREVRQRFAGARWALPAQVYAAPLELYPGLELSRDGFVRELVRLGYRNLPQLDGSGTFVVRREQVDLLSRRFQFGDGPQAETPMAVRFGGTRVAEIRNAASGEPSALFRMDPLLIGSIYTSKGEDRVLVRLEDVPPLLPAGLILVEDRHFAEHHGIDVKAVGRAAVANLLAGRVVQGGSTITQQLVKNFFLNSERTWGRKINEAFMALLLESHYAKNEILEAYLNEVYLGQDGPRAVHGFGLGAQFYFNKPLDELRPHEVALLVALVKGPSYYNPRKHPARAKERRDLVLGMLAEAGYLSPAERGAATARPLGVAGAREGVERYPAFVDLVKRQLKGLYQEADLTHEGLRIFTTLDPRVQETLEQRVVEGLPRLETARKFKPGTLEAAGIVASIEGGEVQALVGGRDARYAGFNRALDARRPIGSLAKPFVYLTALMQPERYNLHTMLQDEPIELELPHGATWAPQNYDQKPHGEVPLYRALAESYNLATVYLGLDVGVDAVRDVLHAAGFPGEIEPLPSMFLGALAMSPMEVTQIYGTVAASGFRTPLLAIREVTTKEGQPLSRFGLSVQQTLPEESVYLLNWALEQVTIFGTARSTYFYVPPSVRLAGKTGTTDDLRDSWFAGYSGDRIAVVWVGRDDNQPAELTGAAGALQIWAPLMRDLKVRSIDPSPPPAVEEVMTDPQNGLLADEGCRAALMVPYVREHAPAQYSPCARRSPLHWLRDIFRR